MILNRSLPVLEANLKKKIAAFDSALDSGSKPVMGFLSEDPSLFAHFLFKDRDGDRFTPFPFQDAILNDKSNRVLVCISRQVGKSTLAALKALHTAFMKKGSLTLIISETKPQAQEVLNKMKDFLAQSKLKEWDVGAEFKNEILVTDFTTKKISRIIVVAASDASRGYSADCVIIDEAAYIENSERIITGVVLPTVAATRGQVMMFSTPNGEQGFFWRAYKSGEWSTYHFNWRARPDYVEGVDVEPKLFKAQGVTYPERDFLAEWEAQFVTAKDAYFTEREIEDAVDKELNSFAVIPKKECVVGCDFGKINDNCVIDIGYIENPEAPRQEWKVVVADRRSLPLGTSYASILETLREIIANYAPRKVIVDATGVGDGPADILIHEFGEYRVEPFKFTISTKEDIYSNLKVLFQSRRIRMPYYEDMVYQLKSLKFERPEGVRHLKIFAPEGEHDDDADCLALLAYGLIGNQAIGSIQVIGKASSALIEPGTSKGTLMFCNPCDVTYWSGLGHICSKTDYL